MYSLLLHQADQLVNYYSQALAEELVGSMPIHMSAGQYNERRHARKYGG